MGFIVRVQRGAGSRADFPDRLYETAGAEVVDGAAAWEADIVIKVNAPSDDEIQRLKEGSTLVSTIRPAQNEALLEKLAGRGATVVALDAVPRISRAQKMDVLSSMANIAGYRAVVEAAHAFGGFFTGQITAAGKTPPARVLVIGAGVAGLAAIGAARGLGAEVRAFDVRESVEEQVKSLGGKFLKVSIDESGEGIGGYAKVMSPEYIAAEMALFAAQAREVDIIITTALIPGQPAPTLITREMLQSMKPGSVVVDLAAEAGGNCEATVAGEKVVAEDVTVIGYTDLTSRMPKHASTFFAQNLAYLLEEMGGASEFRVDLENDAVRGALVVHNGEVTWPPPPIEHPAPKAPAKRGERDGVPVKRERPARGTQTTVGVLAGAALIAAVGLFAPKDFLSHFTVFILAIFVGWQVVWNVTPALHTPLMSVTNAISGIIIVGGLLQAGSSNTTTLAAILGAVAVLVASINIAGGFLVTQRMLGMFRK
jgi:NAD(P) transhydrogenase subunit alpha